MAYLAEPIELIFSEYTHLLLVDLREWSVVCTYCSFFLKINEKLYLRIFFELLNSVQIIFNLLLTL